MVCPPIVDIGIDPPGGNVRGGYAMVMVHNEEVIGIKREEHKSDEEYIESIRAFIATAPPGAMCRLWVVSTFSFIETHILAARFRLPVHAMLTTNGWRQRIADAPWPEYGDNVDESERMELDFELRHIHESHGFPDERATAWAAAAQILRVNRVFQCDAPDIADAVQALAIA